MLLPITCVLVALVHGNAWGGVASHAVTGLRHRSATACDMMLVADEYGTVQGLLTLEDIVETVPGLESVDKGGQAADLQARARRCHRRGRVIWNG